MWITSSLDQVLTPAAVALGNFDGIHLGHRHVIESLPKSEKGDFVYRTVLAFNPHPREYFSGKLQPLLTPAEEKIHLLQDLGVDQLLLLPFNAELAALSPEAFFKTVLVDALHSRHVSAGFNFHFGRDRSGTPQDLIDLGNQYGVPVNITTAKVLDEERISSSRIRAALTEGDVHQANVLLGRKYTFEGIVVQGKQLGRTIGFPTANLELHAAKFLPHKGVYRVEILMEDDERIYHGVMNIGDRPTVDGQNLSVEVHIFDWSGDLYGQTLTVFLADFLRPEQKFNSLGELQAQIQRDCDTARAQITSMV